MTDPLMAFWHKTRRVAVPLTADDFARRAKCSPQYLSRLEARGLVQSHGMRAHKTYSLTTAGLAEISMEIST